MGGRGFERGCVIIAILLLLVVRVEEKKRLQERKGREFGFFPRFSRINSARRINRRDTSINHSNYEASSSVLAASSDIHDRTHEKSWPINKLIDKSDRGWRLDTWTGAKPRPPFRLSCSAIHFARGERLNLRALFKIIQRYILFLFFLFSNI